MARISDPIPVGEATSVVRPGTYNPEFGLWENSGPWTWADPVQAIVSDSGKWQHWPDFDNELGPYEWRVAQSAIENLYRCGYALVKVLPVDVDEPTAEVNPTDWQDALAGTSLRGYLDTISYAELVAAFGPSMETDGYKIDAEWVLRWPDGVVATVYNYKDGPNYLGAEGTPVEDITEWHVGGHPDSGVDVVQRVADLLDERTKVADR